MSAHSVKSEIGFKHLKDGLDISKCTTLETYLK